MTENSPDPVDVHVGARVRMRRLMLGLSQDKLAETVGLTFQQIQKYEKGANRIGASRLFQLASALNVPVQYFYEDLRKPGGMNKTADEVAAFKEAWRDIGKLTKYNGQYVPREDYIDGEQMFRASELRQPMPIGRASSRDRV